MMKKRWHVSVVIMGLFLMASLSVSVNAQAYEARGIVSSGFVYEDVYGVFNGFCLARNTKNGLSAIDIVNSDGDVTFESKPQGLQICSTYSIENGLLETKTGEYSRGVIDTSGKEILSPSYSAIEFAKDGSYILALGYENNAGVVRLFTPSGEKLDEIINTSVSDSALSSSMGGIEFNGSGWNVWFGKLSSASGDDTFSIEVSNGRMAKVAPAWGGSSEQVESYTARNGDAFAIVNAQDGSYLEFGGMRIKLTSEYFSCTRIGDIVQACVKKDYDPSTSSMKYEYKYYWYNGEEIPALSAYSQIVDLKYGERYLALNSSSGSLDLLDSNVSKVSTVQQNVLSIRKPKRLNFPSNTTVYNDEAQGASYALSWLYSDDGTGGSCMVIDYNGDTILKVSNNAYMIEGHSEFIFNIDYDSYTFEVFDTDSAERLGSYKYATTKVLQFEETGNGLYSQRPAKQYLISSEDNHEALSFSAQVFDANNGFMPVFINGYRVASLKNRDWGMDNQAYCASANAWWAIDENGKWGMIRTDGTVVVPFEYEGELSLGGENESLVLVRKGSEWFFYDTAEAEPEPQGASMRRLYNRWTGEHFYTASADEAARLVSVGWSDEGEGWVAPESGRPVYRLYNPYAPGGDHHYTMDGSEAAALVAAGWSDEGVGWYSAGEGGTPLYRQYNPYARTGTHNYTASEDEAKALVSLGWRDEGVAWYGA